MDMYSKCFPGKPESVADARNWLDGLLRPDHRHEHANRPGFGTTPATPAIPDDTRATAVLLLSELATNSLRYTRSGCGGSYNVRLSLAAGALRVDVEDDGPIDGRIPEQRMVGPDDETGRGLALVSAFASAWGASCLGWGTYFRLYWPEPPAPLPRPLPHRRFGASYEAGNPFASPRRTDGGDARM